MSTEMTPVPATEPEPLPGLEDLSASEARAASTVAKAVRRSIVALEAAELVTEVDSARLALALELADIIAIKKATGRLSTVGNDARVLVELLDRLLPEENGIDASLREAMEQWQAVMDAQMPNPEPADQP